MEIEKNMEIRDFPAGNYMLKVNNGNTKTRSEISSTLTTKTPQRHQWRRFGVFNDNFEHISYLVYCFYCLLLASKWRLGYFTSVIFS